VLAGHTQQFLLQGEILSPEAALHTCTPAHWPVNVLSVLQHVAVQSNAEKKLSCCAARHLFASVLLLLLLLLLLLVAVC
jgi:hypothetical protein